MNDTYFNNVFKYLYHSQTTPTTMTTAAPAAVAAVNMPTVLPNNSLNSTTANPIPIYPPYEYYYPTTNNNLYPRRGYQNTQTKPYKNNYYHQYNNNQRYSNNYYDLNSNGSSSSRSPRGATTSKPNNKYANKSTSERWLPSELSSTTDKPPVDEMTNMTINETKQPYQPRHHNQTKFNHKNNTNYTRPHQQKRNNYPPKHTTTTTQEENGEKEKVKQVLVEEKVTTQATVTKDTTDQQQHERRQHDSTQRQQHKSINKKKLYNNNNYNKGKKRVNPTSKSNSTTTNKGEDLKPANFPPLSGTITTTEMTTIEPSKVPKKSIADIVRASSPPTKKDTPKEESVSAKPVNSTKTDIKKVPFSYADMLKKKDQ